MPKGTMDMEQGNTTYTHTVPDDGKFYLPVQCQQCDEPPCVDVCPVQATWKQEDGIVVVDYNWCIGCRYCEAACPYHARRFNWKKPEVPAEEVNPDQGYLSNRIRPQGVVEKCTYCLHRTRKGKLPACLEACPTGARVFGNILDPDSEIRWLLENKRVYVLKEELGNEAGILLLSLIISAATTIRHEQHVAGKTATGQPSALLSYPGFLRRSPMAMATEGSALSFYAWMTMLTAIALVGANAWANQVADAE